jgi:hypothetical protein
MMPWLTVIDMREESRKREDILERLYTITAGHSESHPKVSALGG